MIYEIIKNKRMMNSLLNEISELEKTYNHLEDRTRILEELLQKGKESDAENEGEIECTIKLPQLDVEFEGSYNRSRKVISMMDMAKLEKEIGLSVNRLQYQLEDGSEKRDVSRELTIGEVAKGRASIDINLYFDL